MKAFFSRKSNILSRLNFTTAFVSKFSFFKNEGIEINNDSNIQNHNRFKSTRTSRFKHFLLTSASFSKSLKLFESILNSIQLKK